MDITTVSNDTSESTSGIDSGFTLMEVVWALFLLGLVAMGALGLFINGAKTAVHLQRNQAAVGIASGAMDVVRSVSGGAVNATGTSGVIKGRAQSDVQTVWDEATARDSSDTSDMTIAWDPEGGMDVSTQWVPVRTTATVDNQEFTIDTLIGQCFRLRAAATTDQNCLAVDPGGDNYVRLYRARVVVTWDEGEASTGKHSYRLSSLIDPSEDATWNTAVKPFAYDDEVSVPAGDPGTFFGIVLNDTVEYNASGSVSPVVNLTQPSLGSVSINAGLGLNGVVFTPPADTSKSGTVTFTYKVEGTSGERSVDPATVSVHILPAPKDDTIFVEPGSSSDITPEMLANDFGVTNLTPATRETAIKLVWDRNNGDPAADAQDLAANGISKSGDLVTFDAPSAEGISTTFYYYLVDQDLDPAGLNYSSKEAGSVTVTTRTVELFTPDVDVTFDATEDDAWNEIDWPTLTNNTIEDTTISIQSVEGPDTDDYDEYVRLDGTGTTPGALGVGEALEFLTAAGEDGTYTLTYSVFSPGGNESSTTGEITVTVTPLPVVTPAPVANSLNLSMKKSNSLILTPTQLGTPTTGVKVTGLSTKSTKSGSCRAFNNPTVLNGNSIRVTTANRGNKGTCTFTFTLSTTASPVLESAPATVTVEVNP